MPITVVGDQASVRFRGHGVGVRDLAFLFGSIVGRVDIEWDVRTTTMTVIGKCGNPFILELRRSPFGDHEPSDVDADAVSYRAHQMYVVVCSVVHWL